ncbi:MAG: KH domain-containing protein, partial [Melioribacteraceae bacterium]
SDENERFFVSEIIREKIFEMYREEIPYSTEVEIEEFAEREGRKDYIRAAIIIERESQKPIIIGDKGATIKKLGRSAREAIEKFLQREVFLELFVKVKEKWRSNPNMLNHFGYKAESDD